MRKIEVSVKKRRRKQNLRNAVLIAVGTVGLIAVSAIAPNAMRLLQATGINAKLRYRTKTVLRRLEKKGEIEFIERDKKTYAQLTDRGEKSFEFNREKLKLTNARPKKWDHRYRLVMFDIPERRKRVRERLRLEMREIGFLRIQDSVWIYPHDCEEFIALLKADLHTGKDVLYAVVEEIENDARVRKHFGLPVK